MMDAKTIDLKSAKTVSMIVEQQDGKIEVLTDSQVRPFLNHLAEQIEQMRWIPVGERLPECNKEVLLSNGKLIGQGFLDNDIGFVVYGGGFTGNYVTRWMPLPDRPEGL